MQVQLASDLRKLEALYSQHQRGQHRMRDRLKYLASTETRLGKAEADYAENTRLRDANTRTVTEKGKEKILVELVHEGKVLRDKDGDKMRDLLVGGIKEVTRNSGAKVLFGTYRGFKMTIVRSMGFASQDGFRILLQGAGDQQFQPDNLRYSLTTSSACPACFSVWTTFSARGWMKLSTGNARTPGRKLPKWKPSRRLSARSFPSRMSLLWRGKTIPLSCVN